MLLPKVSHFKNCKIHNMILLMAEHRLMTNVDTLMKLKKEVAYYSLLLSANVCYSAHYTVLPTVSLQPSIGVLHNKFRNFLNNRFFSTNYIISWYSMKQFFSVLMSTLLIFFNLIWVINMTVRNIIILFFKI